MINSLLPSISNLNQLWMHINASIVFGFSRLRCFVILFPLMLKADSDATVVSGMANTSGPGPVLLEPHPRHPFFREISAPFGLGEPGSPPGRVKSPSLVTHQRGSVT